MNTTTTTTTKPVTKANPLHAQQDKVMTLLALVSRKSSKHLGDALAKAKAERK